MLHKKGTIDISELNIPPEKHELTTAKFFADRGKNIKFLRPSNIKGEHTPDFIMDHIAWETKSPHGKTNRCLSDNVRDARKQSKYIIINLHRMKLPDEKCCYAIQKSLKTYRDIKCALVITRAKKCLTFGSKSYKL